MRKVLWIGAGYLAAMLTIGVVSAQQNAQAVRVVGGAVIPAALGQGTMAQGLRVVLPSDQSSIPVTGPLTGYAEGATATNGNVLAMLGCVRANTTPGSGTATLSAVNKNVFVYCDGLGQLYAHVVPYTSAGVEITPSTLAQQNVAITLANITGNIGMGYATSAELTPGTTARPSVFITDLVGKQIMLPYANPENFVSGTITSAMTGTTSTSLVASPGGSLRNYITQCTFSNSHATVGTDMILQDGSGGTTLYVIPTAPAFGGATIVFPTPLRQPTTATALYVANVTTGSNTKASCSGYKGV